VRLGQHGDGRVAIREQQEEKVLQSLVVLRGTFRRFHELCISSLLVCDGLLHFGSQRPAPLPIPVRRAGEKLDKILAPAVVASLQREATGVAHAHGWFRVATAQRLAIALEPVTGGIT
jgi:hypothetical protein